MFKFLRTSIFLIALNFLVGNLPGIMPPLSRFIGLLMLIVWVGTYFPLRIKRPHLRTLIPALLVIIGSIALLLRGGFATLSGLALFVFALQILRANGQESELGNFNELSVCLLSTGFYMGFAILYRFVPLSWYLLQNLSLTLSAAITAIIRQKMTLSATAMGIPISVSVCCYCLSAFIFAQERKITRFLLSISVLIGANVAYLWLQTPLMMLLKLIEKQWHPDALDFQFFLLLLSMGSSYLMTKGVQFRKMQLGFSTNRWWCKAKRQVGCLVYYLPIVILLFLVCLILTFPINGERDAGTVVFYNVGYLDWKTPVFGKYGQNNVGMFGLLPKYLNLRGYQTKVADAPLTEETLQDAKILVVINLTKFLSSKEKQAVQHFIQAGGSLLVLCDHTDVMGMMDKTNDLIQPFNITLNFDTALPSKSAWVDCLEKRPHPITIDLKEDSDTAIWVGASLSISSTGFARFKTQPVIIGKRGWADHGDHQNTRRAFLGDYKRSANEQLGDIILAASSRYGKGKVLVFGDTSPFQNGVLTFSYRFVDRVFDWLARIGDSQNSLIRTLIALLLLIPIGYLIARTTKMSQELKGKSTFILSCILAVSLALAISSAFQIPQTESYQTSPNPSFFKFAYIDRTHFEQYSQTGEADNSIWGLSMNLVRNGYIPMLMNEFSEQALFRSRLFVVIAPTKEFSSHELELLTQYMQTGGLVIWTAGWEDSEASNSFLSKFNFSLDSVPLGSAEVSIETKELQEKYKTLEVQFFEAWPVLGGSKSKKVFAEKWEHPIVVYEPIGEGGLLVIGDSGFLLNRNLESYRKNYKNGNILFLYELLKQFEKGVEK